jgi:hypothetical protein
VRRCLRTGVLEHRVNEPVYTVIGTMKVLETVVRIVNVKRTA